MREGVRGGTGHGDAGLGSQRVMRDLDGPGPQRVGAQRGAILRPRVHVDGLGPAALAAADPKANIPS